MERELIVIAGPTASGKTDLAVHLAKLLDTDIISADSRQFYKYLDIGTAKPDNLQNEVKHHLINSLLPDQDYNVSKFREDALTICKKLWNNGQLPVITGGSGLYIKALIYGLSATPDPDPEIRQRLLTEYKNKSTEFLYNNLKNIDPQSAASIHPNNLKRIIRALEVYYITGKTVTEINAEGNVRSDFNAKQYGLLWDRKKLYSRINERCEKMIRMGLVDETKKILGMGYGENLNSLNTLGYKEMILFINGKLTLNEAVEIMKRNTRRYAKRQLTWFRKDERIEWKTIERNEDLLIFAEKIAAEYLKK